MVISDSECPPPAPEEQKLKPNATLQARREAGAQRTLYAVACKRLIMYEASPSAYPGGMLVVEKRLTTEGGDLMRFYTNQHQFYCGIDLHARSMYVCILSHDGEIVLHRNMKAAPDPFLKAVAPYREGLVVAVECIFTWYWIADLCAQQGIPFVLGHALYMRDYQDLSKQLR